MNVFISGGCKNGKSYFAQEIAKDMAKGKNLPLYYLATMIPGDQEDHKRIARHIKERDGWGFITIEQGVDICKALDQKDVDSRGVFLLDSVTALLQNEMFPVGKDFNMEATKKVADDLEKFCRLTGNTVFVSDYIYSDARHFDEITEGYREGLAKCDKTLAKLCDQVIEVTYGNKIFYK